MKEKLKAHISNEFLYELPEKWIKKIEECVDEFFDQYQPERLSEKTRKGSDSLNSMET
jgi:hypothetical protein